LPRPFDRAPSRRRGVVLRLAQLKINLGSGNDTFNIRSTSPATTLNTGAGANTINVGSQAGVVPATPGIVDNIQGALTVIGSGNDTLNVDDTGNTTGKTGFLTRTTLTGMAMATQGITYSGLTQMKINLGTGLDTFNVQSTSANTVTTLNTGSDANANIINVGSPAHIVDGLQGNLIVQGNGFGRGAD
jgi:hypothetical protein